MGVKTAFCMWLDELSFSKDYIGRYTSYQFDKESIRFECVKHNINISIKQLLAICEITAEYTTAYSKPRMMYIAETGNGKEINIEVTYQQRNMYGDVAKDRENLIMNFYVGLQGKTYKYNGKGTRNYKADIYPKTYADYYYEFDNA